MTPPQSWTETSLLCGDGIRTSGSPDWSVLRVTWLAGMRQVSLLECVPRWQVPAEICL